MTLSTPIPYQPDIQELFQRATAAYTARCHYQGLVPLAASAFKSAVSERFVDLRTDANLKLGIFFPPADEFLCYGHHPHAESV